MSILTEASEIQRIIDAFQWKVVEMDENLNYYFFHVPDMTCNPMKIRLIRRRVPENEELVGYLEIDFFDILLPTKEFEKNVEAENQRLIDVHAPQQQIDELAQIREMFGI